MSSNTDSEGPQSPFGAPNRYTTTHDPGTRQAVFSSALPSPLPGYEAAGMVIYDSYKTLSHPVPMTAEADLAAVQSHREPVWFPAVGQTLLRYCDWPPGSTIPMHRSETIDLGVCVAGRMELTLDSGEVRVLRVGDTIVQRGTMHAWRNPSETEWARVVFFLVGTEPVKVEGEDKGAFMPWVDGGDETKQKEKGE